MKSAFWGICFVVLILLACLDFYYLWRARSEESKLPGWSSPFTLACQGAFAVFAAFYIGPEAFEKFSSSSAIMAGELAFLVLMAIGGLADWSKQKTRP